MTIVARHVEVTITGTATVTYGQDVIDFSALDWDKSGYETDAINLDLGLTFAIVEGQYIAGTTNAGTYPTAVKIVSCGNDNFIIDNIDTARGALEVLRADITGISGNTVQEFDYDGSAKTFDTSTLFAYVGTESNKIEGTFSEFSVTDAGTFAKELTFTSNSGNYNPANVKVYLKVKSVVDDSGKKYTIEDAFNQVSSGKIKLTTSTSFADEFNGGCYQNENGKAIADFYTLKAGVTLLLPFSSTDTQGWIGAGEQGTDNFDKLHPVAYGSPTLYLTLTIPKGITITAQNSTIVVGALTSAQESGPTQDNRISGGYSKIELKGKISLNNSTLRVMGYIEGDGEIDTANNATIIENLEMTGWPGGSAGVAKYIGNQSGFSIYIEPGDNIDIKDPKMFPFSNYYLTSIRVKTTINYGATLKGYVKIATGKVYVAKPQINEAEIVFISSSSNPNSGLFRLADRYSKVVKSVITLNKAVRTQFDLYGNIIDGYSALTLKVLDKTASLSTDTIVFPIDGLIDITLKAGCTFNQLYSYKLMPGATFTVESGSTYNLNSGAKMVVYSGDWKDPENDSPYPSGRGDAVLTVNGSMNVIGSLGGMISGTGSVCFDSNCTIADVQSMEGNGGRSGLNFTFAESPVNKYATLNGYAGTIETGKTYKYDGSKWIIAP